jgi:hypothetical protein
LGWNNCVEMVRDVSPGDQRHRRFDAMPWLASWRLRRSCPGASPRYARLGEVPIQGRGL